MKDAFSAGVQKSRYLIRSNEGKGIFSITTSNLITSGLSFVLFFMLAKYMSTEALGIFFIFYSALMVTSSLFEQGVTLTTIHFYNKSDTRDEFLKSFFLFRVFTLVALGLLGFVFSGAIADHIFQKPELAESFRYAAVAVVISTFVYFLLSIFRAREEYGAFAKCKFVYLGLASVVNIATLLLLTPSLPTLMIAYSVSGVVAFAFFFRKIDWSFFRNGRFVSSQLKSAYVFGRWIFFSIVLYSVSRYFLTFIIARFGTLADVGSFSLAFQILNGLSVVLSAVTVVLFSYSSKLQTVQEISRFVRRSQQYMLPFLLAILLGLAVFLEPLNRLIYGDKFPDLLSVSLALYVGQIFFTLAFPFKSVLINFFKDTKGVFWSDVALLVSTVVLVPAFLSLSGVAAGALGYSISILLAYNGGRYILYKRDLKKLAASQEPGTDSPPQ